MKVKKFIVKDMNEGINIIRKELGKEAIILNQVKVRKPGIKGFFSKKLIKITAAVESTEEKHIEDSYSDFNNKILKDSLNIIREAVQNEEEAKRKKLNKTSFVEKENDKNTKYNNISESNSNKNVETLIKEVDEIKNMLNTLVKDDDNIKVKNPFKQKLIDMDVESDVIDYILSQMEKINENLSENEKFKKVVKDIIKVKNFNMNGPVVFIGPTGVGKTTTIAKLAGNLALVQNKKVGLITIDTYRIGAVEQLKTYAEIMNIPFKVVFSLNEMDEAIQNMRSCDVILVDTTGRSSKNTMQISELRAFINKINTKNISLVISCTTKNKDLLQIIKGYDVLNFNNIIITKLDETTTYGSILNIAYYTKKDISFITIGQNVPDDIRTVDSCDIGKIILGDDITC